MPTTANPQMLARVDMTPLELRPPQQGGHMAMECPIMAITIHNQESLYIRAALFTALEMKNLMIVSRTATRRAHTTLATRSTPLNQLHTGLSPLQLLITTIHMHLIPDHSSSSSLHMCSRALSRTTIFHMPVSYLPMSRPLYLFTTHECIQAHRPQALVRQRVKLRRGLIWPLIHHRWR